MVYLAQIEQRNEKPSDKWIRQVLEKESEELEEDGNAEERALADKVPSERTISRIRKEEWPLVKPEDRARYRRFYWPESMERRDLPWEASTAALELLAEGDKILHNAWQPSIKAVRLFWYVSQSVSGKFPFWVRLSAAMALMRADRNDIWELKRAVQWFLAYKPWIHKKWAQDYESAINRPLEPVPAVPEDLMPLYRITKPVLDEHEFLALIRHWKLEWLEAFGSETLDLSLEE